MAPSVSLSAVSAVGAGSVLDGLTVRSSAVLSVTATTGVTAGAVQLQGSLDGSNWFNLGSPVSTTAAGTTQTVVTSAYAQYVRAAITTAITGGKVSASVGVSG
ncbi:hypothetical protein KV112_04425 [Mycolicibacter sp. MYC123]|uniref:Uncharacterized protein n=1 Tax=[Mycobacterium] zoologicum TaxID=2872311 RepID=A0ABU5YG18_9MYCO|nr:hypothetical protein [Mycolicibacter sp. MYC123]MEB3048994.1 hypothetical protein [Mycolicibacter sp. MYC123]